MAGFTGEKRQASKKTKRTRTTRSKRMSHSELHRFIMHYERITKANLEGNALTG